MQIRLLSVIEVTLSKLIVEQIREAAIGDLWEAHYLLRRKGVGRFQTNVITLWRSMLLLKASMHIQINCLLDRLINTSFRIETKQYLPKRVREMRASIFTSYRLFIFLPIAVFGFFINAVLLSVFPPQVFDRTVDGHSEFQNFRAFQASSPPLRNSSLR